MKSRWTLVAVVVPLLGLAVLVGRAEYASSHGRVWTIPIQGFDPRDLLHGRYLAYRFALHWQGDDTCGAGDVDRPTLGCCVCLSPSSADGFDPFARQVACEAANAQCEAVVRAEFLRPPLRYFVPEENATALETQLRTQPAALEVKVTPERELAVGELMLDRRPWREVVP